MKGLAQGHTAGKSWVQDVCEVPSSVKPRTDREVKPWERRISVPSFSGLKASDRTLVQNEWMEEKVPVIVATISFGMGVDKANVR